ncbi:transglutaminase-like cysteine peptidase [uncultured Pseudacidovorax sp.]|uniref:transglutaminase-like cysteine peptidase n=1 Tax=uncultured Pseudacidovorax sp. TaxID=679313 RepID=UPI0025EF920A|nr:transglutaminase-like cysteine peptidase [uncultured Pseudacidovorax sp.]
MFTQLFSALSRPRRLCLAGLCRAALALALAGLLALGGAPGAIAWDAALMERTMVQRYGAYGQQQYSAWRALVDSGAQLDEREKLRRVNEHWNRAVRFGEDMEVWGQEDYWATPVETLGRGRGDCEDYVIGKYFSLRVMGVPEEKLRLTYVRARVGGATQAHMVLSYYATPEAMPLVLDSLVSSIMPASSRTDLTPVFSFNAEGIFTGPGSTATHPVDRLTRWRDVLIRMRAEGAIP